MTELYYVRYKVYSANKNGDLSNVARGIAEFYLIASNGTEAIKLVENDLRKMNWKSDVFEDVYTLDPDGYDKDDYDTELIEYAKKGRIMSSILCLPE